MTKKRTAKKALDLRHIEPSLRKLAVPIERLRADSKNARVHDEQNLRAVEINLRREGQYSPLLANSRNNEVVIGNCRLEAARRLGWTHLAVVWRELTDVEQRRLSLTDNRTAELGDWDQELLDEILAEIRAEDADQADLLGWQLALDELDRSRDKDQKATEPQLEGLEYRIVILCKDEEDQAALLARFEEEGIDCQALIS